MIEKRVHSLWKSALFMKEWWSGAHSVFENGSERVSALIFFSNEWELSEAQKISERWTRWQTKTICSSLYYYLYLKHNNYKSVSQLRVYDSWKQISLSPRNAAYCSIRINWQFRLMCQTNNIKLESKFTLKFKKSGCLLSVNAHKKLSAFFARDKNAVCF